MEMAVGGKAATQIYEGERKLDGTVRYPKQNRDTEEKIGELRVPTIRGGKVALKEIADIGTSNGQRFTAVKFSIRDRDMGSTIAEAQQKMDQSIKLGKGYRIEWAGEFENQVRATKRLTQVVPVSLYAGIPPALPLLIHGGPGWQVMRQITPGATRVGQVAQGIEPGPQRVLPLGCVFAHQAQVGAHKCPFVVRNIAGVTPSRRHLPNLTPVQNRL
ncbi:hypothetical protein AXW84_07615 [Hymenobacter sp. PAMC 26628]|nr:hypothetical protein AXW84_07615 [Hymenobacter sp. PAMC 26628]